MKMKAYRFLSKAYDCLMQENYVGAKNFLESAMEVDPENDEIQAYLGEIYILNCEYEKATAAFTKRDEIVLRSHPLTSYINGYRGRIFLEEGNLEKAKELLSNAMKEDVKDPEIFYSLALAHLREHKFSEAINALQKISSLDPAFYHRRIQSLRKSALASKETPKI